MGANDEFSFGKHYFILDKKLENHINAERVHGIEDIKMLLNELQRILYLPADFEDGKYTLKATVLDGQVSYTWEKEE